MGAIAANSASAPTTRATARALGLRLAIATEGDAVKLHAMVDQAEAELLRDPLLQCLELIVDEFDDITGLNVNQMVVMVLGRGFVPGPAVAELVPLQDASLFEQANGTVDGRDRNVGIDR